MKGPMEFWKRLDRAKRMSIKELCDRSGIRYDRVLHNRSDCRYPKVEDVIRICKATGISSDYLLLASEGQDERLERITAALQSADEDKLSTIERLLMLK